MVNPGSVGLQAYDDDHPYRHKIETGSPDARWAMVTRQNGAWHVQLRTTPYDFETAARRAEAGARPEWAHALRTGLMPP